MMLKFQKFSRKIIITHFSVRSLLKKIILQKFINVNIKMK